MEKLAKRTVAFAVLQGALAAQWFGTLPLEQLPGAQGYGRFAQVADLDGDGDLDAVFWRHHSQPLVYRNQGAGRFTADSTGMPTATIEAEAVQLADIDGNGFPDLIAARTSGRIILWKNQGGVLTDVSTTAMPSTTLNSQPSDILPFDCEGDGDIDLLVTAGARGYLFVNNGSGVFTDGSARLPALNIGMGEGAAVDVDGDGDRDLLLPRLSMTATQSHLLYLNNGGGTFTDASAARMPAVGNVALPGGGSLAAGDIDGDGDADVVVNVGDLLVAVYRNNGSGFFAVAHLISLQGTVDCPYSAYAGYLRMGDLDGDGDRDVLFIGGEYGRYLLRNDGTGAFTFAPSDALPQARQSVWGQEIADLDGDGDLDIVQATPRSNPLVLPPTSNPVLFQDGHGHFFDAGNMPLPPTVDDTVSVLSVDLDRDGLVDVVHSIAIGGSSATLGMVFAYRNRGDGTFLMIQRLPFDQILGGCRALATADVDGDGWPDVYAGSVTGANLLFRNLGNGTLGAAEPMPSASTWPQGAVFGDFDGDGDPDLVTVRVTGSINSPGAAQTLLFTNDGSGHFVDATVGRLPVQNDRASKVLAFDLQGDGDLDLYIGNPNYSIAMMDRLLVNDGSGHFVDQGYQRLANTSTGQIHDAALGDLDGNGVDDLMLVDSGTLRVLLDNGYGFYVDASETWRDNSFYSYSRIATADFDEDGRIDLLATAPQPKLLRNLPTGRFQVEANTIAPFAPAQWNLQFPALADYDGDGDLDLLHATPTLCSMHWNLRHQISLPLLPKPGTTIPLRIHADPGHATGVRAAFFAASTGRLRATLPFGTLWLDPSMPISIQAGLVSAPGGIGEVQLTVGPWPELQGAEFTVQGLVLTADGSFAHLTNALTARIQ